MSVDISKEEAAEYRFQELKPYFKLTPCPNTWNILCLLFFPLILIYFIFLFFIPMGLICLFETETKNHYYSFLSFD